MPRLERFGAATHLMVGDRPFLILGGELGNSSASDPNFLLPIWPRLRDLGLNTVLVPVSWELVEPSEGSFDFSLVRTAIREARRHDLRLVLLWFGSWKNSMSCYAPGWVKDAQGRFPRAEKTGGRGLEILSAFSDENRDADARAFAALMRFVRDIDEQHETVVMVQVENEVGMLEEAAERGPAARAALAAPFPPALLARLRADDAAHVAAAAADDDKIADTALRRAWIQRGRRATGSWEEVLGASRATDEIFTAWHLARYVNDVARAGKAAYTIPMFVNAALNRAEHVPGQYPSGGPLPHLYDVWKAAAPDVDFLSPDIYFPDFAFWCDRYARADNPLFIPEAVAAPDSGVHALYAFGAHDTIGFSPFAIDSVAPAAGGPLADSYAILAQLAPLILERQGQAAPAKAGVLLDRESAATELALGGHRLHVRHDYTWEWASAARLGPTWPRAGGLILATAPDEFVVAGNGLIVTFGAAEPERTTIGIASIDEGRFESGRFVAGRRLNGDESHQGRHLRLPCGSFGTQRVRLYRYR